jgi:hypothetical protein
MIRNGLKVQVIDASIRSWPFLDNLKIYHLMCPCRNARDPEFQQWVDSIGDGTGPDIDLLMLKQVTNVQDILDFVFPIHVLTDPLQCLQRSILAPTNRQVDMYNANILKLIHGEQHTYMAMDCLKEVNAAGMVSSDSALDYVSKQNPPGLPPHTLTVKVNGIYQLIHNFSIDRGLVKNVQLIVTDMGDQLITVHLIHRRGDTIYTEDKDILIPRILFTYLLPSGHTLLCCQFPLALGYATTFNRCQGLNLDCIAINLTHPVFFHGQLYTVFSHIPNRTCTVVRLLPGKKITVNVTYNELLLP